jgi:hypothetical protein
MLVYVMAIWSTYRNYCHLVYFWSFCTFYGYLVYFFTIWYVVSRKIWQPWFQVDSTMNHTLKLTKTTKRNRESLIFHAELGSMLWSKISVIFGDKIGVFLKNQCYDQIFA